MNKKILIGSIVALLLIFLTCTSVVNARTIKINDLKQQQKIIPDNLAGGTILRALFNLLLGFLAGVGFITTAIILYLWLIILSALHSY
ncbi:MAG: hypothetical protein V1726_05330 [Methanobacteriota archaeon]